MARVASALIALPPTSDEKALRLACDMIALAAPAVACLLTGVPVDPSISRREANRALTTALQAVDAAVNGMGLPAFVAGAPSGHDTALAPFRSTLVTCLLSPQLAALSSSAPPSAPLSAAWAVAVPSTKATQDFVDSATDPAQWPPAALAHVVAVSSLTLRLSHVAKVLAALQPLERFEAAVASLWSAVATSAAEDGALSAATVAEPEDWP